LEFSLDRLLVSLEELEESRSVPEDLTHTPPEVIFASDPAVLIMIDGDSILQPVQGSALMRVVNTPYSILLASGRYCLYAGAKYLRFILDRYFADESIDALNEHFFAFASYNAGPARVARLRSEAAELGLDPNVWFRNVENVAARRIGRETVQHVSNIYKYYLAYRRIEQLESR
jgi:hypothetical protein